MLHPGLVSITFRQLSVERIIELVADSGLEAIEWGGDIHVPHGDTVRARQVAHMTRDAGLTVSSYGSYYRVGHQEPVPFTAVLDSALALGAPVIRVWAGKQGSNEADGAYWERVIQDSHAIGDLAAREGLRIAYEFHGNTLTDTAASVCTLLESVGHESVLTYWQPSTFASPKDNLASLEAVLPWLVNLHLFAWRSSPDQTERMPLAAGAQDWAVYLRKAALSGRDHFALIEFVKDDQPEQFANDAATLRQWLINIAKEAQ